MVLFCDSSVSVFAQNIWLVTVFAMGVLHNLLCLLGLYLWYCDGLFKTGDSKCFVSKFTMAGLLCK